METFQCVFNNEVPENSELQTKWGIVTLTDRFKDWMVDEGKFEVQSSMFEVRCLKFLN